MKIQVKIFVARSLGQSSSKIAAPVEFSVACYDQKDDSKWLEKGAAINYCSCRLSNWGFRMIVVYKERPGVA